MISHILRDLKLSLLMAATGLTACASQRPLHGIPQATVVSAQPSEIAPLEDDAAFQTLPLIIYEHGSNGSVAQVLVHNPDSSYNQLPVALYLALDQMGFYTAENPAGAFLAAERMGPEAKDFYDQVLQAAATKYPLDARLSLLYRVNTYLDTQAEEAITAPRLRAQYAPQFPTSTMLRQSLTDKTKKVDKIDFLKHELGTLEAAKEPCYRVMLYAALTAYRTPIRSAYLRSVQKTMPICLKEGDACAIAAAGDVLKDATGIDRRRRERYFHLTQPYSIQCKSISAP